MGEPNVGKMASTNTPSANWVATLIPQRLARKPHLITFKLDGIPGNTDFGLEAAWINAQGVLPYQAWISRYNLAVMSTHEMRWYLLGAYSIQKINGTTAMAYQYEHPFPSDRICLMFLNWEAIPQNYR